MVFIEWSILRITIYRWWWSIDRLFDAIIFSIFKEINGTNNIIIADIRDSDLRGYRSLEQFSKKFRWNLPDYHVVDKIADE